MYYAVSNFIYFLLNFISNFIKYHSTQFLFILNLFFVNIFKLLYQVYVMKNKNSIISYLI